LPFVEFARDKEVRVDLLINVLFAFATLTSFGGGCHLHLLNELLCLGVVRDVVETVNHDGAESHAGELVEDPSNGKL